MDESRWIRRFIGVVAFFVIGFALLAGASAIATPYWSDNSLTDKVRGLAREPENTVDVLFVGTSTVADGIQPMTMYEDHGVSAYNGGMSKQPTIASYCVVREALQRNPESLRTVVFDPSSLRLEPDPYYYKMTLDGLSIPAKYDSVGSIATDPLDYLGYLFPVLSYHGRWQDYGEGDVELLSYPCHPFLRGYVPSASYGLTDGWLYKLAPHRYDVDPTAIGTPLVEKQLDAFERMVSFCRASGINLVLAKLPALDWASGEHVAVERLAERYDLPFIDYNFDPLASELAYNQPVDSRDNFHLNDYGAARVSSMLAGYLVENGYAVDRRGDPDYAHLEDYLVDFHAVTDDLTALRRVEDPVEYLAEATDVEDGHDWTVYIGATGNGVARLSADQRRRFGEMGYEWLANMDESQLWTGVVENGELVREDVADSANYELRSAYSDMTKVLPRLPEYFILENTGLEEQDAAKPESATLFNAIEWKDATPGIVYVVYDNDYQMVVDVAKFRLDLGMRRLGNPQGDLDWALSHGVQPGDLSAFLALLYDFENSTEVARRGADARADYLAALAAAAEAEASGAETTGVESTGVESAGDEPAGDEATGVEAAPPVDAEVDGGSGDDVEADVDDEYYDEDSYYDESSDDYDEEW